MIAKTQDELDGLRAAGKLLAHALRETAKLVKPGITTASLDLAAEKLIRDGGGVPAFLNYKQDDSVYPFPASLCVSINDEVVHGIPSEDRIIQDGDLVMLDLGLKLNGYFSDMAVTVIAGEGSDKDKAIVAAVDEAFAAALKVIKPGARMGDIGAAIESVGKKYGFAVVDDLGGHSLGRVAHEPPFVSNTGVAGTGIELAEGLVLAIEPIFTQGGPDIELLDDQWTFVTADGSRSAETEHTIIVTKDGAEVLTK